MDNINVRPLKSFLFRGIVNGKNAGRDVVVGKQDVITTTASHARQLTANGLGLEMGASSESEQSAAVNEAAKETAGKAKAEASANAKAAKTQAKK